MLQGKVYFIGVGLGDAELITLKGYRLIYQADIILHDHLIPPELLRLAKGASFGIPTRLLKTQFAKMIV